LVRSNFRNWLSFFAVHCGRLVRTSSPNLGGEGKKSVGEEMDETWVEQ